jgi:signal transduction histidine kinase
MEPILVDQLVSDEVHIARVEAEDRSIPLSVRTEPVAVSGSRHDLSLAVRNLLANALRYTQRNGSVGIDVRLEGDRAVIEVTDTGLGIPTRDLPRIFERFYRVDAARSRETGGTGLGLAIVKHVVEGHGGSVEVESELGRGSKFTIRLPALELS